MNCWAIGWLGDWLGGWGEIRGTSPRGASAFVGQPETPHSLLWYRALMREGGELGAWIVGWADWVAGRVSGLVGDLVVG